MRLRFWALPLVFLCFAVVFVAAPAIAQQGAAPVVVAPNFAKATTPANAPPCVKGLALEGNPKTGPHVVIYRFTAGCIVPWHWHTAEEKVMMVSGEATIQVEGGKPEVARSGAFFSMPSHHIHEFTCPTACEFFASRTAAFDIHYVSPDGNEISLEQALAATKKPAAKKPAAKKASAKPM